MKKYVISTWRFSLEAVQNSMDKLKSDCSNVDCIEKIIKYIENDERVISVGYSGLPNCAGFVEMDAAIMDGNTLSIGAVAGIRNIKNPISLAKHLLNEEHSNFLCGQGALLAAEKLGLEKFSGLCDVAEKKYKGKNITSHDTVGTICINEHKDVAVGTSTSGLFMKKIGRIGDSPLAGCGYYADSDVGAAAATGMGEDIMKMPVSFLAVEMMSNGMTAQQAAEAAINKHLDTFKQKGVECRDFSIITMKNDGAWGASTTSKHFSFVVYDGNNLKVYLCFRENNKVTIKEASKEWILENIE